MLSWAEKYFICQDIASAIDEEDVTKFTDVVKEFDSMTPLVILSIFLNLHCIITLKISNLVDSQVQRDPPPENFLYDA